MARSWEWKMSEPGGNAVRLGYQISTWHTEQPRHAASPQHKVILLGTAGVGKTAFFLRVRDGVFSPTRASCCTVDYYVKDVPVPSSSSSDEDTSIKVGQSQLTFSSARLFPNTQMVLYDTAGGERFRSLTSNFYRNAHAAVLMFSVDDAVSFYKMELEVQNAQSFVGRDFVWVVVGSKSDLKRDPYITEQRVEVFCAGLGSSLWLYVSAKTGENVDEVLEVVARELHRRYHSNICLSKGYSDTVRLLSIEGERREREKTCRTRLENCRT